jgi:DNA polymerase phi
MPKLRQEMIDTMTSACDGAATLNAAQMKDLFKLALLAIRQTRRVVPQSDDMSTIWEPSAWDNLRKKLGATERFKTSTALHAMCEQTIRALQVTSSPTKSKGPRKDIKSETPSAKRKKEVKGSEDEAKVTPKPTKRKKVKKDNV